MPEVSLPIPRRDRQFQHAGWLTAAVLLSTLSGCASAPGSEPVIPSFGVLAKTTIDVPSEGGVALLGARIADLRCAETQVVVGREGPAGFTPVRATAIASQFGNGADTAAIPLPVGTYHLLQIACRNGVNVTVLGASEQPGTIPWQGASWGQSIGSFAVSSSGVADLGMLVVTRQKSKGFGQNAAPAVMLSLEERSEKSRARLATSQPNLAARAQPAPFALSATPPANLARCRLSGSVEAETAAKGAQTLKRGDPAATLNALSVREPIAVACQPATGGGIGG